MPFPQFNEALKVSFDRSNNTLIIKRIRSTSTNGIMPIIKQSFSMFSKQFYIGPTFPANNHSPDFQYIAQTYPTSSDLQKSSRIYLCSLLNRTFLRKCPFFVPTLSYNLCFKFETVFVGIFNIVIFALNKQHSSMKQRDLILRRFNSYRFKKASHEIVKYEPQ